MSQFQISPQVDANKIFLIQRAQLEGRIDPHQYHHERLSAIAALRQANQVVPLYQIVKNAKQTTTDLSPSDIYIGLENIVSDTGEYIATSDKQSISSAGVFKKGQVLFPKLRPYLNKVYLAGFDGLCSTEFHIFETDEMDAEFLAIYLRSSLIVNQTRHLMTGNTLPRLQTEDINRLPIPLLLMEKQRHIVDFYNQANQIKQQKEQQAAALLATIDEYLLGELGITLPEQDNSLEKRVFRVSSREVSGCRFDAPIHRSSFSLNASKFPMVFLTSAFEFNPNTLFKGGLASFVPMEKISDVSGAITSTQDSIEAANASGYTRFQENDLLWARITPCKGDLLSNHAMLPKNALVQHRLSDDLCMIILEPALMQNGKSAVARNLINGSGFGSTEYFIFRSINKNSIDYLHALLRLKYVRQSAILFFGGATGHQRVTPDFFNRLKIPLPPIEKQNEIVTHIQSIRTQAAQLQAEAAQVLADAKAQIERMILGDS